MKTPKILYKASRQYRHNTGDDSLIKGFDYDETCKVVNSLQKKNEDIFTQLKVVQSNILNIKARQSYANVEVVKQQKVINKRIMKTCDTAWNTLLKIMEQE